MLKRLLHIEYVRLFKTKSFYFVLLTGVFFSIWHAYKEAARYYFNGEIFMAAYPLNAVIKWLGMSGGYYPMVFFQLSPLLVAIPYGGSLQKDRNSGYIKNICTRVPRRVYFTAKLIVGMSVSVLYIFPLVLNYFVVSMFVPNLPPISAIGTSPIFDFAILKDLFYTHFGVYVIVYLLFDLLFVSLMLGMCSSSYFYIRSWYTAITVPFLVSCLLYVIMLMGSRIAISPFYILWPAQVFEIKIGIIFIELVAMCACVIVYLLKMSKADIL